MYIMPPSYAGDAQHIIYMPHLITLDTLTKMHQKKLPYKFNQSNQRGSASRIGADFHQTGKPMVPPTQDGDLSVLVINEFLFVLASFQKSRAELNKKVRDNQS